MSTPLRYPTGGLPPLCDTPEMIIDAARRLAAGRGPIAIDTERASGFRYNDRAFLLQLRRTDTGTILIDPENNHDVIKKYLAPVLNGEEWIIHAASTDLPCLGMLGLYPGSIIDTELAARLLGLKQTNLGACIHHFLGYTLEKKHSRENWSTRPLPKDWLIYAALDVEKLLDLAEVLIEMLERAGRLVWAEQEFQQILRDHAPGVVAAPRTWRTAKGINRLRTRQQLAVFRELWDTRDNIARSEDVSPGKICPTPCLIDLAVKLPTGSRQVAAAFGKRRVPSSTRQFWLKVITDASNSPQHTWPELPEENPYDVPSKRACALHFPEIDAIGTAARHDLDEVAAALPLATNTLIHPTLLRYTIWHAATDRPCISTGDVIDLLAEAGARDWQCLIVGPILARHLVGKGRPRISVDPLRTTIPDDVRHSAADTTPPRGGTPPRKNTADTASDADNCAQRPRISAAKRRRERRWRQKNLRSKK